MNSFSTKKNKLKFIHQKNQIQTQSIDNQKLIQKNLINKVNQNKTPLNLLSKLTDLSFDWEVLDILNIATRDTQYKVWEIEWDKFDTRLLPYIDIKFLYRVVGGNDATTESLNPRLFKFFELTDIENDSSDYYKKVKLIAFLHITKYQMKYTYEAKLNLLFINPRKYI